MSGNEWKVSDMKDGETRTLRIVGAHQDIQASGPGPVIWVHDFSQGLGTGEVMRAYASVFENWMQAMAVTFGLDTVHGTARYTLPDLIDLELRVVRKGGLVRIERVSVGQAFRARTT